MAQKYILSRLSSFEILHSSFREAIASLSSLLVSTYFENACKSFSRSPIFFRGSRLPKNHSERQFRSAKQTRRNLQNSLRLPSLCASRRPWLFDQLVQLPWPPYDPLPATPAY